jgi:phosphoribosylanthranilate isomerase
VTRVKICGITRLSDARLAVELGAAALGFIFVPDTPRYALRDADTSSEVSRTLAALPPFVERVCVVDSLDRVSALVAPGFSAVQFYSGGDDEGMPHDRKRIRAFRLAEEGDLDAMAEEIGRSPAARYADAYLLDAKHPSLLGGTGRTFDWRLARRAQERFGKPVVLAGGLNAENVGEAIAEARPYAVDVSGGVETSPGQKDPEKLCAFFAAVCEADRRLGERP